MQKLINLCVSQIDSLPCPRNEPSCDGCFSEMYYTSGQDQYNCTKELFAYTVKYGPAYVAEILSFLTESRILDSFNNCRVNVLSIGGGLGTDYIAIKKYLIQNKLNIDLCYTLVDKSPKWQKVRDLYPHPDMVENTQDVMSFDFNNQYDIVFINKLFSTLKKNGQHEIFLKWFSRQVKDLKRGAYVIFCDINHCNLGRDIFDYKATAILTCVHKYYTDGYTGDYTRLPDCDVFESTGTKCSSNSVPEMTKVVFFIYQKQV